MYPPVRELLGRLNENLLVDDGRDHLGTMIATFNSKVCSANMLPIVEYCRKISDLNLLWLIRERLSRSKSGEMIQEFEPIVISAIQASKDVVMMIFLWQGPVYLPRCPIHKALEVRIKEIVSIHEDVIQLSVWAAVSRSAGSPVPSFFSDRIDELIAQVTPDNEPDWFFYQLKAFTLPCSREAFKSKVAELKAQLDD